MLGSFSNPQITQDLPARHPGIDGDGRAMPPARIAVADARDAARADGQRRDGRDREGSVDAPALCRLLSLLADRTRLRILWLLADGERAVGAMTTELGLPQPTVS